MFSRSAYTYTGNLSYLTQSEASADEDDEYFQDAGRPTRPARYRKPRPTDERGYVSRRSVMDDATRPEYIIPVGSADGVWGMIKRLGRFRSEGWLSLWKGTHSNETKFWYYILKI